MEQETGLQLIGRVVKRPDISSILSDLIPAVIFPRNGLIEINGLSGTGKTLLMMDAIAHCILDARLGGCGGEVVLLDLDHRRDLRRLVHVVESLIAQKNNSSYDVASGVKVKDCLERLKIVQCFNIDDLMIGLYELERLTLAQNHRIALICIEGVTSVYWSTRARCSNDSSDNPFFTKLAAVISRISAQFNIPFVATQQILFRKRQSAVPARKETLRAKVKVGGDITDDFLGKEWSRLVKFRITMESRPSNKALNAKVSDAELELLSNFTIEVAPDQLIVTGVD